MICPRKPSRFLSALFMPCVTVLLAGGCSSQAGQAFRSPAAGSTTAVGAVAASPDDAQFSAGSHRPPTPQTLFAMARILESQGKDSDAEYVLRTIIKNHSRFMPAYCDLAEVLVRQRRIEEAVQILRVARSRAPDDAVLVNDLGMCCLLRNDFDAALAEFTRAAALAPDDARYRGNMAVALGMMGRYSESLALYRQVTSDIEAHYNLAVLCEARHDHLRANAEFNAAREARNLAASARAAGADAARDQAVQTAPRAKEGFAVTTRPTG